MPETTSRQLTLTPKLLIIVALVFQVMNIPILWNHTSDPATVLGRYSTVYAAALAGSVVIFGIWMVLFFLRERLTRWLARIPLWFSGMIILLMTALVWSVTIELHLQHFIVGNLLLGFILHSLSKPDVSPTVPRVLLIVSISVLLLLLFVTHLYNRPYSPDEAIWADISSSLFVSDGMHRRLQVDAPILINPGVGWVNAIYGWALDTIAFDLRTGRVIHFLFYILIVGTVGLVARRFYDKRVAVVSMMYAIVGTVFFLVVDYRPDHFLPLAQLLAFFAVAQAYHSEHPQRWHFGAGLIVTLSMQLHAAGIAFAFGFSLFYGLTFFYKTCKARRLTRDNLLELLSFGIGAGIGTGIYYVFNVAAIGGIQAYLDILVADRYSAYRDFDYLLNWHSISGLLAYAGLALMLWRRSTMDKLYLGLFGCLVIGIFAFDTQGYVIPYRGMFIIPTALALTVPTKRQWLAGSVLVALALQLLIQQVNWHMVRRTLNGDMPPHIIQRVAQITADRVQPEPDERIAGIVELMWGFPDHRYLYSTLAEENRLKPDTYEDGLAFWEQIQPDIIIDMPQRLGLSPGLRAYLEQADFIACDNFAVQAYDVIIYRQRCDS